MSTKGFIIGSFGTVPPKGYISVEYPEGSVCTATHTETGQVLTAPRNDGSYLFPLPAIGAWTVTSTDGTNSKSQTVNIEYVGQKINIVIIFPLILVENSISCSASSRAADSANATTKTVTVGTGDFTNYKTLYITVSSVYTSGNAYGGSGVKVDTAVTRGLDVGTSGTIAIDISTLVGDRTVYLYTTVWSVDGSSTVTRSITISKAWLEA